MGQINTNLLLQRIAEQACEQRMIRNAALEDKFRKLPNPTSPRNDKLVHNLSSKELTKDQMQFLTAESDTTVSSSTQFLEKLKGVSIHPNEVMVSFDVTSLFTFIPHDLAIETIALLLQSKYDETENRLGRAQILQLLKFCLRTYFTFDGTIYEQVKGTPMGSPISGFIAEAVLQRLESLVFQHHKPKFSARYVDDTLVVIDRDQLLTFKERLNAVFSDIQFTMEEEENNQLAFLDVLVCR
nr:unnamed protein product [Spirometra erinaceieuropaei]